MEKETLHHYLYRVLREQIVSSTLPQGSLLPSSRELSKTYNVGMRTVKDVMHTLHEEGYICLQERKRAVIIYHKNSDEEERIFKIASMHKRNVDILHASNVIFPSYYARAVDLFEDCDLDILQNMLDVLPNRQHRIYRKIVQEFHLFILSRYHNPIVIDLYLRVEHCLRIPIIDPSHPYPHSHPHIHAVLSSVVENYRRRNSKAVFVTYRKLHDDLLQYSQQQIFKTHLQNVVSAPFTWNPQKGRTSQYTRVFQSLVHKIITGQYQDQEYLPSLEALANEYTVSLHTIRKALRQLNAIGLSRTRNGVGTQCTLYQGLHKSSLLEDEDMRQDTLLYLSSVQFIAMNIRSLAFENFSQLVRIYCEHQKLNISTFTKNHPRIFHVLVEVLSDSALKSIYTEIRDILLWGSYFSVIGIDQRHFDQLMAHYEKALHHLRTQQAQEFAIELEKLYVSLFYMMREYICSFGIHEAAQLTLPS